jgi:thiazole/oxazole-forming peptide maturase SagD family component
LHPNTEKRSDSIERIYSLDTGKGCPVHIAAAVTTPDQWGVKRVVSGRGLNPEMAMRRCIAEALERQSAIYSGSVELVRSSYLALASTAIHPPSLLQISDTQYANRLAWNAAVDDAHKLPPSFDETQDIGWVWAHSLSSHATKLIPAAYCFLGYPNANEEGFPIPDSSGLAAGEATADAMERGLLELIERDAVSIWWYNQLAMPPMMIDHAALAIWQPFMEWIKNCGRKFWLLDLSGDLCVPVAAAVSCNDLGSDLSFGFAAANTPEEAAENAMSEMVQFEVTKRYHQQAGPSPYPHFLSWCQSANISDHDFVVPSGPKRELSKTQPLSSDVLIERLANKGLEAFAMEFPCTGPHTNVVRVIVPGLRPIWPRLAAGRLYNVPHELGWVERTRQEADLNPTPILY